MSAQIRRNAARLPSAGSKPPVVSAQAPRAAGPAGPGAARGFPRPVARVRNEQVAS
jgi:hypothetical protein